MCDQKLLIKTTIVLLITLSCQLAIASEPWGKDAKMVCKPHSKPKRDHTFFGENLIWFHKKVISPADGPRSHHKPNSSKYTMDAMRKYGFVHGYLMGCDRLMRENEDPWIYKTTKDEKGETFKWDPVK